MSPRGNTLSGSVRSFGKALGLCGKTVPSGDFSDLSSESLLGAVTQGYSHDSLGSYVSMLETSLGDSFSTQPCGFCTVSATDLVERCQLETSRMAVD